MPNLPGKCTSAPGGKPVKASSATAPIVTHVAGNATEEPSGSVTSAPASDMVSGSVLAEPPGCSVVQVDTI